MPEEEFPFQLEEGTLQQQLEHATRGVYLRSFWWTADGKKHNSEAAKGHIYYGRVCTRELLWYHDVLLGQPQFGMEQSLLDDINLIWEGQDEGGNVPRGYGASGPDFHYDTAEFGRFDERFDYDYTWIYNPIDNVAGLIITTVQAYHYTGDKAFLQRHYRHLQKAFSFMDSVTQNYLYGVGWDGQDSVDWREQTHIGEGIGKEGSVLAEDIGINGCTTYNQALFYQAIRLLADAEEALGHFERAKYFKDYAAKVREQSNRGYRQGGLWDSESGTYIGWRGRGGQPHFLYGSYRFEPMAQIWAAYWGLAGEEQVQSIASLFDRNFDRYITPHGYVMVCDPAYRIWDGWYFGGYAAVVLGRCGYQDRAWQCLRRMAENFTRPGQPYEHESLQGEAMNQCSCNVVPVINALRVVKEAIFGIGAEADALHIRPLLKAEGHYGLTYRGRWLNVVKKGDGPSVKAAKLNRTDYPMRPGGEVVLPEEALAEENTLELQT
ncbi:MAG: hypothetical protein B1H40_02495 [Candidatus Latescibacteria bacterium 4484_181]|nr:MAG: hypothetical protein B1H40_02495 [Candidatus Latescibacteria bacterium 4484_181]RKY71448.1 MAG: hypothetical protein DRQ24_07375 [Candidatus Latescibacterota bacterium]